MFFSFEEFTKWYVFFVSVSVEKDKIAAGWSADFRLPPTYEAKPSRQIFERDDIKSLCNANSQQPLCFWSRFLPVMLSGISQQIHGIFSICLTALSFYGCRLCATKPPNPYLLKISLESTRCTLLLLPTFALFLINEGFMHSPPHEVWPYTWSSSPSAPKSH